MKKKMNVIALLVALTLMVASTSALAADTSYTKVTQLKSWSGPTESWPRVDVYLSGQSHTCGTSNTTRFVLQPDDANGLSLLTATYLAGKTVQLNYYCQGGSARIRGVRMK